LRYPGPAFGQRADENAVTAAQDAFGTSIGFQNVGLYSANDGARVQFRNRLETSGLRVCTSTSRRGDRRLHGSRDDDARRIAAQSYSFPRRLASPT